MIATLPTPRTSVQSPSRLKTYRFQPQEQQEDVWNVQFPIDVFWAIYARQSTPAQLVKHVQSTEMQTDELQAWLIKRSVADERIALYDADLGMSGQLRIDQRPDLLRLVNDIERGKVKAVLVYQISRLFRDLTAIQYNTFAEICKQQHCILVTSDGMLFNFNNPIHLKMFRMLAEMAAEYIPQQIKLLHEARLRKARKGVYAGLGPVATGYIVDYNEKNPTYGKYLKYEEWGTRVLWFFERYYALCGDWIQLCRDVDEIPVLFPDMPDSLDKRNLPRGNRRKVPGGYHISEQGLRSMMTNPVYLGWWLVAGDVISRENHEPIIDKDHAYLFWYAFERLSRFTLDGELNEYRGKRRFYQQHTTHQGGILKKRVISPHGDVFVNTIAGEGSIYVIYPKGQQVRHKPLCQVKAQYIDDIFSQRFLARLEETHDFDHYQQWVNDVLKKRDEATRIIETQLRVLGERQQAALAEIIETKARIAEQAKDEAERKEHEAEAAPFLNGLREQFNNLEALKKVLLAKLPKPEETEEYQTIRKFADFQTEVRKLVSIWNNKPFDVRMEFVNLFVESATITCVSPHWLQLDIVWAHPSWEAERIYSYRERGSNPAWTDDEQEILRTHYLATPKDEILQLLPDRSWACIHMEARHLNLKREVLFAGSLPKNVTWSDWQFMQEKGIAKLDRSPKFEVLYRQN